MSGGVIVLIVISSVLTYCVGLGVCSAIIPSAIDDVDGQIAATIFWPFALCALAGRWLGRLPSRRNIPVAVVVNR